MSLTQCPVGHDFDAAKFPAGCPWCKKPTSESFGGAASGSVLAGSKGPTGTVVVRPKETSLPVGWLVALRGPDMGRDFRLEENQNTVGRVGTDKRVTVGLTDSAVSSQHCDVFFDAPKQGFVVIPHPTRNGSRINGELVVTATPIQHGDRLEIGQSLLVLVAFNA